MSNIENHEHILGYYGLQQTYNNFYLIYQYYNEGTLQKKMTRHHFDEKISLLILKQLLEAYKSILKYNVKHQDLKPQTIYFYNGIVKLKDLGESKKTVDYFYTKTTIGYPERFMAPEGWQKQKEYQNSDIWSLGVIVYEMIYGMDSFFQLYRQIIWKNSSDPNIWKLRGISKQTKSLLRRMIVRDPSKRIEWAELFAINITAEGKIDESPSILSHMKSDNGQSSSLVSPTNDPKSFHVRQQTHQKL